MTLARKQQICLEATPYYHLINRCVRRSFLCGYDKVTRKDFSHRKQWLLDRLHYLVDTFAIKVCAYAVMSNHYHLVVCVDTEAAKRWTRKEVIERYARLHSTQRLVDRLDDADDMSEDMRQEIAETIDKWRDRLSSISWFEKSLNEYLARAANREDRVSGRFWQGRFKSQPLLDDAALITCMVYVDLNPIRAGIAQSPETSDFTSIQQRLRQYVQNQNVAPTAPVGCETNRKPRKRSARLIKNERSTNSRPREGVKGEVAWFPLTSFLEERGSPGNEFRIPIFAAHYFDLLETTGRAVQAGKRGSIPKQLPTLVSRLGLNPAAWLESITDYKTKFPSVVGKTVAINDFVEKVEGRCRCVGKQACIHLYHRA